MNKRIIIIGRIIKFSILVFITLSLTACSDGCEPMSRECSWPGCENTQGSAFAYCSVHRCAACRERARLENSQTCDLCLNRVCSWEGCGRLLSYIEYKYCYNHNCQFNYCTNQRMSEDVVVCVEHMDIFKCKVEGCENNSHALDHFNEKKIYCDEHECIVPGCYKLGTLVSTGQFTGMLCSDHEWPPVCEKSGCTNTIDVGTVKTDMLKYRYQQKYRDLYCPEHSCQYPGCKQETVTPGTKIKVWTAIRENGINIIPDDARPSNKAYDASEDKLLDYISYYKSETGEILHDPDLSRNIWVVKKYTEVNADEHYCIEHQVRYNFVENTPTETWYGGTGDPPYGRGSLYGRQN